MQLSGRITIVLMIAVLLGVIAQLPAYSQNKLKEQTLDDKVRAYGSALAGQSLILHFDRSVYRITDSVRFAAYLIESDTSILNHQSILGLALIDGNRRVTYLEDKFLIDNGVTNGCIAIPDTLLSGKYFLAGYTNLLNYNGLPVNYFYQPITVIGRAVKASRKLNSDLTDSVSIKLIDKTERPDIHFYPEGGHLTLRMLNTVGLEVHDKAGRPLPFKGNLTEDGKTISKVAVNASGLGRFSFTPKAGSKYTLWLPASNNGRASEVYELPEVGHNRPGLTVSNALTNDTLRLFIKTESPQQLKLLIHNYRRVYINTLLNVVADGAVIKVDLNNLPKGLATVCLLDSANGLLAERMFFAHVNQKDSVLLTSSKTIYKPQELVNVDVSIINPITKVPLQGVFSVACILEAPLQNSGAQNIAAYSYFIKELQSIRAEEANIDFNNRALLEDLLLVKSWKHYDWKTLLATQQQHISTDFRAAIISGKILNNNHPLKKAVTLTLLSGAGAKVVLTDPQGRFVLNAGDLAVDDNKTISIKVSGNNRGDNYQVIVDDELKPIIIKELQSHMPQMNVGEFELSGYDILPQLNDIQTLKAVKVTGKRGGIDFVRFANEGVGRNACGDYVCAYGGLNCQYQGHWKTVYKPVKGKPYIKHSDTFQANAPGWLSYNTPVTYSGCINEIKLSDYTLINGIQRSKEVYEYRPHTNDAELSKITLYWNPALKTDTSGKAGFSFPAGSLPGVYRVVLQGVTTNDVIYSTMTFQIQPDN